MIHLQGKKKIVKLAFGYVCILLFFLVYYPHAENTPRYTEFIVYFAPLLIIFCSPIISSQYRLLNYKFRLLFLFLFLQLFVLSFYFYLDFREKYVITTGLNVNSSFIVGSTFLNYIKANPVNSTKGVENVLRRYVFNGTEADMLRFWSELDIKRNVRYLISLYLISLLSVTLFFLSVLTFFTVTIKIFLASSNELDTDRKEFAAFINTKNNIYSLNSVVFQLFRWEDYESYIVDGRLQDKYNQVVRQSDIFIGLIHTKMGEFSKEEFNIAQDEFDKYKRPFIYLYFKQIDEIDIVKKTLDFSSLNSFKDYIQQRGHYITYYKDINHLKNLVSNQLDLLLSKQKV